MQVNIHYERITDNISRIVSQGDGYYTKYNAYIVKGSKGTALIDSSPSDISEEFISAVKAYKDIKDIDYFIFTHTDSKRAGAAEQLIKMNSKAKVIASIAGLRNLKEIINDGINEYPAKDNAVIDLGGISLKIIITPNIGWPDTMMLYCEEDECLFSGSMFLERGNEHSYKDMELFLDFAESAYKKALPLKIQYCCPSEGECSGKNILEKYRSYFNIFKPSKDCRAVIVFAGTQNGYTAELVDTVAGVFKEKGIQLEIINVKEPISDIMESVNKADLLCFASPTIHRNAVPEIMDVITRIDRVNKLRTPCMVIGSYGWGGEALGFMANYLKLLKLKVFEKPFGVVMKPTGEDLKNLRNFTARFIDAALKNEE